MRLELWYCIRAPVAPNTQKVCHTRGMPDLDSRHSFLLAGRCRAPGREPMSLSNRSDRLSGVDLIKALFSVAVVVVHLGYVWPSKIFSLKEYCDHSFGPSDAVNFYLLLLAVPLFFLMSNYLYIRKVRDGRYLQKYLLRIVRLACFWIVIHTAFECWLEHS